MVRLNLSRSLHGHTLFAKIKDHASGDAIETGKGRSVHLVPRPAAPVRNRLLIHVHCPSDFESILTTYTYNDDGSKFEWAKVYERIPPSKRLWSACARGLVIDR